MSENNGNGNGQVSGQTEGKTPQERFKITGNRRVYAAMEAIEMVGKLSSRHYEYTPAQVEVIRQKLQASVDNSLRLLVTRPTTEKASVPDLF